MPSVLAIAAHPDDIEFVMAGTLILLAQKGWDVHYMNIANGCCGSMHTNREETAAIRLKEAQNSAAAIPAQFYPPIADDLSIQYTVDDLEKVTYVMRKANPSIVLTHSPIDYMEDHEAACRLAVTAAFSKNMPNHRSQPAIAAPQGDVAVYHAQPHGNCSPLGEPIHPHFGVDVTKVVEKKKELLSFHASQQGWLDSTQKMSSYTATMLELGESVAKILKRDGFMEGWRQRNYLGFGPANWNPLADALGEFIAWA